MDLEKGGPSQQMHDEETHYQVHDLA